MCIFSIEGCDYCQFIFLAFNLIYQDYYISAKINLRLHLEFYKSMYEALKCLFITLSYKQSKTQDSKNRYFTFMQTEKSDQSPLQFISREALKSIYLQFVSGISKHNAQLFYNYEEVLEVAEGLLRLNISHYLQSLITPKVAQSLFLKYSPSTIIYAIIINAFQFCSKLVNFHNSQRNRFFISHHTTLATVFLQTFVNILEQLLINSAEYALQLLQRISAKIKQYLQQMRKDPSIITMTQQCSDEISIKTRINLVEAQKANYQPDDLIYSSKTSRDKGQFYFQLYENMKQRFGEKSAKKLVEEVLMVFGAATYIETFKRQPNKINVQQPNNGFLMEMPYYGQLADIDTFSLKINFISTQPQTVLEIVLSFSSKIKLIPIGEFNLRQKALAASIQKITDKQTVVQNLVYQIQKKSLLGKGSYGSVFRCDSLQLIQQQIKDQVRIFRFRRRKLAAKQLNLTQEEREKLLIPANREHLILSLINELRHREQINDCKRYLGFQVESSLNGIQNIIPMVEYFKLEYQNEKKIGKQQLQHFFLTFQFGNTTLSNKDFLNAYAQSQPFFQNLQFLFKKIFRGLSFLHYEIGQKYPLQLNRYYRIQNGDENNHEKDPQQSLILTRKNGIWLRDVKPSNVVVTLQGNRINDLWLIDFGMALIGQITVRNGATSCGSEYYMSPEVRNGMRQDQRVDVWSAGVILFEMYSRENRKLYSSIDVHVMNTVNERIGEQIDNLARDDQDWKRMMRAALAVKIENLRSSKEEAARKNSQQIVRLMDNKKFYLKKTDLNVFRKQFKEAKVYKCMQNLSDEDYQIFVEQVHNEFEWKQKDKYSFRHFFLKQYFKYSAYSPCQSLKIALACLLHAQNINPNMGIDQLIIFLSQLQVFTAQQLKETNQTIFIKHEMLSLQKKVNVELIRDMQQTISFATVANTNLNKNSHVILSTDIVMKGFQPDFINCYSQDSANYLNGYSFQQGKIESRVYFVDERSISDFKQVKEYTNKSRVFVTRTQLNCFEVFILKDRGIKTQNQFLPIVNEITGFLMYQIEKYGYSVSFKEATNQISRQNFAHLMQIEQINRNLLIIHYNKKTLSKILQNFSDLFVNKIKEIVTKILKEDKISMNYQIKQTLCLYLTCVQIEQFKIKSQSDKFNKYSNYNLLTKDLKVFSEYLSFVFSQSAKIHKKSTKKAVDIVNQWVKLNENYFGATFLQKQAFSEQQKLKLHQEIRFVRSYCEKLPQMSALERFSEIFKRTAQLGISLSDHLNILKVFFDIK